MEGFFCKTQNKNKWILFVIVRYTDYSSRPYYNIFHILTVLLILSTYYKFLLLFGIHNALLVRRAYQPVLLRNISTIICFSLSKNNFNSTLEKLKVLLLARPWAPILLFHIFKSRSIMIHLFPDIVMSSIARIHISIYFSALSISVLLA